MISDKTQEQIQKEWNKWKGNEKKQSYKASSYNLDENVNNHNINFLMSYCHPLIFSVFSATLG